MMVSNIAFRLSYAQYRSDIVILTIAGLDGVTPLRLKGYQACATGVG
ncbi:hypothetical protein AZZ82_003673 [Klebsiella aerogenes]|nr:hypothetical protein AZZ82_003673 [Klebsiella aerogenes]